MSYPKAIVGFESATTVVVNVQTTGLDVSTDRIIEIAILLVTDTGVSEYSELIRPLAPLSSHIVQYTGISDEMLSVARSAGEVLPEAIDLIGDRKVVAFNAEFVTKFLKRAAMAYGRTFDNQIYNILDNLFAKFDCLEGGNTLFNVASSFGIDVPDQKHRARTCAAITYKIFQAMSSGKLPYEADKLSIAVRCDLTNPSDGGKLVPPKLRMCPDHGRYLRAWPVGSTGHLWSDPRRDYINVYWPEGEYGTGLLARIDKPSNPSFAAYIDSGVELEASVHSDHADQYTITIRSRSQ